MSDQLLRDALHGMAGDAPEIDTTARTSGRTWQQARAAHRRAVVTVSVAVALVLLGGFLAVGLTVSARPTPANPPAYDDSELAIPDEVWTPSPWTPSTDDAGPLGPLALISEAQRHDSWFHQEDDALFGVSAIDGTYRFIDLPDAAPRESFSNSVYALSPDGQKIGYWTQGRLTAPLRQSEIDGYAVYDSVTGKVTEHRVATRFGLGSERSLVWSGDSVWLVASFYRDWADTRQGSGSGRNTLPQAWNPRSGDTRRLPHLAGFDIPSSPSPDSGGAVMAINNHGQVAGVALPFGQVVQSAIGPEAAGNVVVSPDGTQVVYNSGGYRRSSDFGTSLQPVNVATQQPDGSWQSQVVPTGDAWTQPVAWLDAHHVFALMWFSRGGPQSGRTRLGAVSLDVRTGKSIEVVRLPTEGGFWPAFAVGLADQPFVARSEPSSRDPRLLPGIALGVAGGALVLIGVFWFVRRDRRDFLKAVGAVNG